jgi:DNA-binding FadR family transcriptional regulator
MALREKPYSQFMDYLAHAETGEDGGERLPSLNDLSKELGISVSRLREQMEVARALGLVEVRPRTGMRRLPYEFLPGIKQSLFYALSLDRSYFESFADLRKHIEEAYWFQAVEQLQPEDLEELGSLVSRAWKKLHGSPVQIPQDEHRQLHLLIYRRLNNPFVLGILEAYWDAYEAVGLNVYADYAYLEKVWEYHQAMVEAIRRKDFQAGYQALADHTDLIYHRPDGKTVLSNELTNHQPAEPESY